MPDRELIANEPAHWREKFRDQSIVGKPGVTEPSRQRVATGYQQIVPAGPEIGVREHAEHGLEEIETTRPDRQRVASQDWLLPASVDSTLALEHRFRVLAQFRHAWMLRVHSEL